jgi:hypothetical protein
MRPLGRTCLAGHLVIITVPLTALLALVDAWRPRARSGMRTPLLVVSVLNTVLAVWAERAGSRCCASLRPPPRPPTRSCRDHADARAPGGQAERGLVGAVGPVLSLAATATAQAGQVDGTWNKVSSATEPVVVATSRRT